MAHNHTPHTWGVHLSTNGNTGNLNISSGTSVGYITYNTQPNDGAIPRVGGTTGTGTNNMNPYRSLNYLIKTWLFIIGKNGGEKTHVLTIPEMPAHTHQKNTHTGNAGSSFVDTQVWAKVTDSTPNATNTGSTGGGLAHNNLQPFLAASYVIKT